MLLADSMPGLGSIVLAAVLFPGALILALLVAGIRRLARWQGVLWLLGEILAGVAVIAMTIVALVNVNDLWRTRGPSLLAPGFRGRTAPDRFRLGGSARASQEGNFRD